MLIRIASSFALGLAANGCGSSTTAPSNDSPSGGPGPQIGPITGAVAIHNSFFSPSVVEIEVTGSVTWTNFGPSRHSTVSDAGLWDSGQLFPPWMGGSPSGSPEGDGGDLLAGDTYTWIFTEPGLYSYHCGIHPDERGTVRVTSGVPPPAGPGDKDYQVGGR